MHIIRQFVCHVFMLISITPIVFYVDRKLSASVLCFLSSTASAPSHTFKTLSAESYPRSEVSCYTFVSPKDLGFCFCTNCTPNHRTKSFPHNVEWKIVCGTLTCIPSQCSTRENLKWKHNYYLSTLSLRSFYSQLGPPN